MCKLDGQGHEFRRLVAGVAEHQALITGAEYAAFALDPLGDLHRLSVDPGHHLAGLGIDAGKSGVIARLAQQLADQWLQFAPEGFEPRLSTEPELPGEHDETLGEQGLAGDPGARVQLQAAVEHAVRDAVGQLVGMPVGDGLGCKQPRLRHGCPLGVCRTRDRATAEFCRSAYYGANRGGDGRLQGSGHRDDAGKAVWAMTAMLRMAYAPDALNTTREGGEAHAGD